MKSIVVTEIVKQINDDGTELEVLTNQYKRDCEYLLKKEILMSTCKLTVDKDAFKTAMGGTLAQSSYRFSFDGTDWKYSNNTVDLSDYGITLEGTPKTNNYFDVYCDTETNVVTSWLFTQYQNEIYIGGENEICNYVNISSSIPNMMFNITATNAGFSVLGGVKTKSENIVRNYDKLKIAVTCSGYYEPTVITIILAKVI